MRPEARIRHCRKRDFNQVIHPPHMNIDDALSLVPKEFSDHLEHIREMFEAPYFVENGMEPVSISRNSVVIRKKVGKNDWNSNGFWHGGAIFGVMDHAFAILTNLDGLAVGQSSNVNYYRPGKGELITAKAEFVNRSRSLDHVYIEAFDGDKLVASGISTAFRVDSIHR